jgi:hypothetical protein
LQLSHQLILKRQLESRFWLDLPGSGLQTGRQVGLLDWQAWRRARYFSAHKSV